MGGSQGDLFINVVTKNFSGDIDIFAAEGLLPLTKIVIFADGNLDETGRLIYLRKEERLILRIQGRTPDDDPATFRIKFGGSFIALEPNKESEVPTVARASGENESGVRVNSVGTIVEVIPKPTPVRKPVETAVKASPEPTPKETKTLEPPKVVVSENIPKPVPKATPADRSTPTLETVFGNRKKPKKPARPSTAPAKGKSKAKAEAKKPAPKPATPPPAEEKPDPLASIRLIVLLKNGDMIERPMSEVQSSASIKES